MKKTLILIFITIISSSCSSISSQYSRGPASPDQSCKELMTELLPSLSPRFYKLSEFPDLPTSFIDQDERLKSLVELHDLPEHQEQSRIILGLLKKKSPELDSRDLARSYLRLYNCPRTVGLANPTLYKYSLFSTSF